MEKELSKFQFTGCKIVRTLMEVADNASHDVNLKVSFKIPEALAPKDKVLLFPMGVAISNQSGSIKIEVDIVGSFIFTEDVSVPEMFAKVNAPAILFPYIRSYVTAMTSRAGLAPIVLPTFNMTQNK